MYEISITYVKKTYITCQDHAVPHPTFTRFVMLPHLIMLFPSPMHVTVTS